MIYGYIVGIFLSILLSIYFLNVYYKDVISPDVVDEERIGTKLLAAGKYEDAILQYTKVVESDPTNYLIYYLRATAYLALGRTKRAFQDLSRSLSLNPEFTPARSERAKIYLKQGYLQNAKNDILVSLRQKPDVALHQSLVLIGELESLIESAKTHNERNECNEVITHLNRVIETTTLSQSLREMRGNCYMKIGDSKKAILDFRQIVKLSNDDRAGMLRLSELLYEAGRAEESLIEIRDCLKLDPDHKECFKHYKKIKKLVQLLNSIKDDIDHRQFVDCISKSKKLKTSEPFYGVNAAKYLCTCELGAGHPTEAVKTCDSAHLLDLNNKDIVCDLADAHIANKNYNSAITYFQKALNLDKSFKRAKDGFKKVQKLLKQSRQP